MTDAVRTLLVEDSLVTARLLGGILARSNTRQFDVTTVRTLKEARTCLGKQRFELVLLDLGLPDSYGIETFYAVRNAAPDSAIIVESSNSDEDTASRAIREGAQDYILKDTICGDTLFRSVRYSLERKQAADAVVGAKRLLTTILESLPFGVVIIAEDQTIRMANPAAAKMVGEENSDALVGTDCHKHLCGADSCSCPALVAGADIRNRECVLHRKDNTEVSVIKTVMPVELGGEKVLLETFVDISEHKRMEVELQHARKLESVGRLAAGIAHEINTPVQFIGDNVRFMQESVTDLLRIAERHADLLDTLGDGVPSEDAIAAHRRALTTADIPYLAEELPAAATEALDGVDRVAKLVRAMKEFSHPGAPAMALADINEAIETTIVVARNEWKYVAEMETHFDAELPLVPCLLSEFNQVILNMIVNARDAIADVIEEGSASKGMISISTRKRGRYAEIRVKDTGGGISPEARDRIFDPFYTTKDVGKGSGQGLAIARSIIVDKHGGTVRVEGGANQGATFVISLPIEEKAGTAIAPM